VRKAHLGDRVSGSSPRSSYLVPRHVVGQFFARDVSTRPHQPRLSAIISLTSPNGPIDYSVSRVRVRRCPLICVENGDVKDAYGRVRGFEHDIAHLGGPRQAWLKGPRSGRGRTSIRHDGDQLDVAPIPRYGCPL